MFLELPLANILQRLPAGQKVGIAFSGGLDTQWSSVQRAIWPGLALSTIGVLMSSEDLIVHDEQHPNPAYAFLLSRMDSTPGFPTPLGVLRAVNAPLFEVGKQIVMCHWLRFRCFRAHRAGSTVAGDDAFRFELVELRCRQSGEFHQHPARVLADAMTAVPYGAGCCGKPP